MDEAALGGPESVEQPRALLHVVAQAEESGHEKEYLLLRFATQARGVGSAAFTFYLRVPTCQSSTPSRPCGGKQAFFN